MQPAHRKSAKNSRIIKFRISISLLPHQSARQA